MKENWGLWGHEFIYHNCDYYHVSDEIRQSEIANYLAYDKFKLEWQNQKKLTDVFQIQKISFQVATIPNAQAFINHETIEQEAPI